MRLYTPKSSNSAAVGCSASFGGPSISGQPLNQLVDVRPWTNDDGMVFVKLHRNPACGQTRLKRRLVAQEILSLARRIVSQLRRSNIEPRDKSFLVRIVNVRGLTF